ncbi:hypothetical protein MC885_017636 [Smutsia gigantea]|nr:hypothetical protein MC885_017636 [Smutsia gigantea]
MATLPSAERRAFALKINRRRKAEVGELPIQRTVWPGVDDASGGLELTWRGCFPHMSSILVLRTPATPSGAECVMRSDQEELYANEIQ